MKTMARVTGTTHQLFNSPLKAVMLEKTRYMLLFLAFCSSSCHHTSLERRDAPQNTDLDMSNPHDEALDSTFPDASEDLHELVGEDLPKLSDFPGYVFHSSNESIEECTSKSYGYFDKLKKNSLPIFATIEGGWHYIKDEELKSELQKHIQQDYFLGLDVLHSDGKIHLFECMGDGSAISYHTDDVYVRCRGGVVEYKFNEYESDYDPEERRVELSCRGGTTYGPFIRNPWFDFYKSARESRENREHKVFTYNVIYFSKNPAKGYKVGPIKVYYDFISYNGICIDIPNMRSAETDISYQITRL